MSKSISVVLCTLNRAQNLDATVNSLLNQVFPGNSYEIIVVDNGSTDHTRQVVEELQQLSDTPLLYAFEPVQGLSIARNKGIQAAEGQVVAFIDDDALANETWLMALMEPFTSVEQADAVGGPIEAIRPTEIPSWVPRRLHSHLSIVNYGTKLIPLKYPHYPFGTNMAFRRAVFEKVGLFDPSFGRKGMTSLLTGEETDLFLRIERAGGIILYNPSATVYHNIHPERLRKTWFYNQTYWIGFSSAVMEKKSRLSLRMKWAGLLSVPIMFIGSLAWIGALIIQREDLQVYARCAIHNQLGYLHGLLKK